MKPKYLIYTLIFSSILLGCVSDDIKDILDIEIPLLAIVSLEQTVAPFTEVTLDGSASTGPEGFNYEWIYNGSETINLSGANSAMATFTPEVNGTYTFTLRITLNGEFSETQTIVTVTGAVVLDASSFTSEVLLLTNVNPFEDAPDYLINVDFTIPTGNKLRVGSGQNVTIGIADGAGIIVNGTLSLGESSSQLTLAANGAGWKGILVDGGNISSSNLLTIDKAGSAAFDGQEAAAITFVNNGSTSLSSTLTISNTVSDLGMVLTNTTSPNWDIASSFVTIDAAVPVKAGIGFLPKISSVFPTDENNYDYFHFTTSGAGVTEGSISGVFSFVGRKYFIDGDFTAGSRISTSSATIYMKEGAGIVGIEMNINNTTIEGLDGATWKGIAASVNALLNGVTITGAGSATHDTGAFTSIEKAAVYGALSTAVQVANCTITNSGGYGVYLDSQTSNAEVSGTTFADNANYDVNVEVRYASFIKSDNTWGSNVPVLLRGGNLQNSTTILELGNDASYLIEGNLNVLSGILTLRPGVNLKFQADKGLSVSTKLTANGTVEKPIIFDGEAGTSGSWKGIELLHQYSMEYCTITNGGSSDFVPQNPSNIIFGGGNNTLTPPQTNYKFDNNTVSNSAGWGWQVKSLKYDPLEGNDTNTFENNAIVDTDGDGIPDGDEFPGCENDPFC